MIYVLKGPDGKLIETTASCSVSACWEEGFWVLCAAKDGFREKYWKRWDASRAAARRLGYVIVKCDLVER